MEVGEVGINEGELCWEEIIGMGMENRMIEDIEWGDSDGVEVEGSGGHGVHERAFGPGEGAGGES